MARICTVCARGGSKGVPNKNVRELLGRPLLVHTVMQAQESGMFEQVAVSSDSEEILAIGSTCGDDVALVRRPDELASDTAGKLDAIRHAVSSIEERQGRRFDVVVDLDATSPLRTVDDIREAVGMLEADGVSNVITATPARHSPYFNLVELDEGGAPRLVCPVQGGIVRRQDSPACFDMNASIYVWQRDVLFSDGGLFREGTRLYEMPRERSVDIDDEVDFMMVERLAGLRKTLV